MTTLNKTSPARRPPIYVAEGDYERLAELARVFHTPGAELLADELERAVVVGPRKRAPSDFVRLGSKVTWRDETSGRRHTAQIVGPEAADIDRDRLSVISPVGAALIGLRPGAALAWAMPDGRPRTVRIESVTEGVSLP
jgi:regulator of nucleoside diphosphate kinase